MTHDHAAALSHVGLNLASRGWHVFPLIPGTKRPAIRAWEERATTDPERIARCWATGAYNIGIGTGPSGLVVLDLDTAKDASDTAPREWNTPHIADGADVLAALCQRHGQPYPSETYTVRTGRGGTHLYLTAPEGTELRNSAGKLGWKVDTRAMRRIRRRPRQHRGRPPVHRHPRHPGRTASGLARRPVAPGPSAPTTARRGAARNRPAWRLPGGGGQH